MLRTSNLHRAIGKMKEHINIKFMPINTANFTVIIKPRREPIRTLESPFSILIAAERQRGSTLFLTLHDFLAFSCPVLPAELCIVEISIWIPWRCWFSGIYYVFKFVCKFEGVVQQNFVFSVYLLMWWNEGNSQNYKQPFRVHISAMKTTIKVI
jgi:hypothetical protein